MRRGSGQGTAWGGRGFACVLVFASGVGCATGASAGTLDAAPAEATTVDAHGAGPDAHASKGDGGPIVTIGFGDGGGVEAAEGGGREDGSGAPGLEAATPDATADDAGPVCTIGGATYAPGTLNPADLCQTCQTTASTTSWTNLGDGTSCGGSQTCVGGKCGTVCVIASTSYPSGTVNPANACQTCQPGMTTSAWTTLPEGTTCGAGLVCNQGTCAAGCSIDGTVYAVAAVNPSNPCEVCSPTASVSTWSNRADGAACGSGETCAGGRCGTQCEIAGATYATGTANPENSCQTCAPGTSATSWTTSANGASCGAQSVCNGGACTVGCYVGGTYYAASELNPNNTCQVCTPATSTTAFGFVADGTTCANGGGCTSGQCVAKNPFDASSCDGPPITQAEFNAKLGSQDIVTLANYTMSVQSCQGAGCTSWANVTSVLYDGSDGAVAYNLTGAFDFNDPEAISFESLVTPNVAPSQSGACGLTNPINQANNAFECYIGEFQAAAPITSGGMTPNFTGLLTNNCVRLTATSSSGSTQFRWAILASF